MSDKRSGSVLSGRHVCYGSRLCENVHEPRMPRIVFSIAYFASAIGFYIDEIEMENLRAS